MYYNLSAALTAAQIASITTAIGTIKGILDFLINLTPEERRTFSKMGDQGFSYVTKSMDYANANPHIIPATLSYAEGRKDLDLVNALRPIWNQLMQLAEMVDDTKMAAGIEAKEFADKFYELVKMNASMNVPGMDVVAADLGTFYEKAQAELITPPQP